MLLGGDAKFNIRLIPEPVASKREHPLGTFPSGENYIDVAEALLILAVRGREVCA